MGDPAVGTGILVHDSGSGAGDRIFDLDGPETLGAPDVAAIYEEITSKILKIRSTPPFIFNIMRHVLRSFNPAAANLMALNYAGTQVESVVDTSARAPLFGIDLTRPEIF